jgi:hypothetical protein
MGTTMADLTVRGFCDHIGIEPVRQALRATEKHNTEHVWLIGNFSGNGWERVYYHDTYKLDIMKPEEELLGVGVGGIAWDGTDWEWGREEFFDQMHHPWQWSYLDTMREEFCEALLAHQLDREMEKTDMDTIDRAVDDGHHRQNHNLRHIFDLASHRFRIKIKWDTSYDYQSRATLEKWSTGWTQVEALLPVEVKDLHDTEKKLIDLARQFVPCGDKGGDGEEA